LENANFQNSVHRNFMVSNWVWNLICISLDKRSTALLPSCLPMPSRSAQMSFRGVYLA
jgi:hypothetical protein